MCLIVTLETIRPEDRGAIMSGRLSMNGRKSPRDAQNLLLCEKRKIE